MSSSSFRSCAASASGTIGNFRVTAANVRSCKYDPSFRREACGSRETGSPDFCSVNAKRASSRPLFRERFWQIGEELLHLARGFQAAAGVELEEATRGIECRVLAEAGEDVRDARCEATA